MCCGTSAWSGHPAVGVRPGAYVFRLHDTGEVIQRFSLSEEQSCTARPTPSFIAPTCTTCWPPGRAQFDPDVVRLNHQVDRLHRERRRRRAALRRRHVGARRSADRRRRAEIGGARADVRRGARDLHRRRGLARRRADRAAADGPARTGHVGVHGPGRPRRLLLPARRHAAEFRRHRRDRRGLGGILDRQVAVGRS